MSKFLFACNHELVPRIEKLLNGKVSWLPFGDTEVKYNLGEIVSPNGLVCNVVTSPDFKPAQGIKFFNTDEITNIHDIIPSAI